MKHFFRIFVIILLAIGVAEAKGAVGSSDTRAGYHDGCTSAQGHYTRSRYKYAHSRRYHRAWIRGKRSCAHARSKKHHRVRRHHRNRHDAPCTTQVPWTAFRRGYDHGYRSAKGHFYVDHRGCAAYRQGWVSGYRSCHCPDRKKPDSYASGYAQGCNSTASLKIRDNLYYKTSRRYRHGWIQGYRDCRGVYR